MTIQDSSQFVTSHAISGQRPFTLDVSFYTGDDNQITKIICSSLKQQRDVKDHHLRIILSLQRQKRLAVSGDEGMENLLKFLAVRLIPENTLPQKITVDGSILTQNLIAKDRTDLSHCRPRDAKKMMHAAVSIEHGDAPFTKQIGRRRFSRGNSPSKTNNNHFCPRIASPWPRRKARTCKRGRPSTA